MRKKSFTSWVQMTEDEVVLNFIQFDGLEKGGLSVTDILRVATAHDFTCTDDELSDMIRCFDTDGDGRCFRIVHAPIFLRSFASDRRHMKDPVGNWIAEPPSYEPIVVEDKTLHNLNEYIEIGAENISTNVGAELINDVSNKKLGVVMNKNQLEEFFPQVSR